MGMVNTEWPGMGMGFAFRGECGEGEWEWEWQNTEWQPTPYRLNSRDL
jgi:hypothetical protein